MNTIREAYENLRDLVRVYLSKDKNGKYRLETERRESIFLRSKPGIGKSKIVEKLSKDCNIGLVTVDVSTKTRTGMEGLPVIEKDDRGVQRTVITPSSIMELVMNELEKGNNEGILFLDELPCASESIKGALHALLLNRSIGNFKLPEGWIIIAAGNPAKFNRAVSDLGYSLMDRVILIDIEYDANASIDYLNENNLNQVVIDYLTLNKKDGYYIPDVKNDKESYLVTPRSWTNLAELLDCYESEGIEVNEAIVNGYIKCRAIAGKFYKYYKEVRGSISMDEIRALAKGELEPNHVDRIKNLKLSCKYRIVEMCASYLKDRADRADSDELLEKYINNIFIFIDEIDNSNDLSELLYKRINEDMRLLEILGRGRIEAYNQYISMRFSLASGQ